jgi:hypothetical protein
MAAMPSSATPSLTTLSPAPSMAGHAIVVHAAKGHATPGLTIKLYDFEMW